MPDFPDVPNRKNSQENPTKNPQNLNVTKIHPSLKKPEIIEEQSWPRRAKMRRNSYQVITLHASSEKVPTKAEICTK